MTNLHPRPTWLPETVWPYQIQYLPMAQYRGAYTDVGHGPALLFCHAGMWQFVWRDLIGRLRSSFRCVTFDPLGSGLSDRVPANLQTLTAVRDTTGHLIDHLDLRGITLVLHDLGGVAALAAAAAHVDRLDGLVAANTFGWRPTGILLPSMLRVFGSVAMRELDALTAFLPAATSTRFGVGRHLDRPSRKVFRNGMDRAARRTMHRLFRDAARDSEVFRQAETTLEYLRDRPSLSVFGAWSDYLRFQPKWHTRLPQIEQKTIPRGLHFPMCDNPAAVAAAIARWHPATAQPGH
ncbi:haloalkane dehalogenase [Kibdelosporangium banguiense]|uniref:Haloalkane dehalogenase n=1 Tax=Kibdelosporangium banguiense TaxID=1365924 RepID=A0ABS4TT11_9PSEU|nr:alpha/beta fold hydrolase [Kibdelosporangium banguiense]MBP2327083.1 haloalkane dehalogenase [Kibdelosporangium banguiense]